MCRPPAGAATATPPRSRGTRSGSRRRRGAGSAAGLVALTCAPAHPQGAACAGRPGASRDEPLKASPRDASVGASLVMRSIARSPLWPWAKVVVLLVVLDWALFDAGLFLRWVPQIRRFP